MNILEMNHIKKSFADLEVLKNISVSVSEGEVVAIIGPSGSGKSTLLRCATLLETIDSGEIIYEGIKAAANNGDSTSVYANADILKSIRSMFGLVFQNFNLFPHYSVLQNITDALITVQKIPKEPAHKNGYILLEKMGLTDKAGAYPYQLSGGQQQRVSIARALALNPQILFFDEPTSALDPELTGDILRAIRDLAAERMTMVIVTHEIEFARKVADRVVFMADGVIVEQGPPGDVILRPRQERTKTFLKSLEHE